MRPFNVLRAAFLLLAAVIGVALLETLLEVLTCLYAIGLVRTVEPGSCAQIGTQIRDLFSEAITAVLALLVARTPPPPPDPPPDLPPGT
jgi:hypothetical protein